MKIRTAVAAAALSASVISGATACEFNGPIYAEGSCVDNGNGTYSYTWLVKNTATVDVDVVGAGTNPSHAVPGPSVWSGTTFTAGSWHGAFNTDPVSSMTLYIATRPTGTTDEPRWNEKLLACA